MVIHKTGKYSTGFYFICNQCGAEWSAERKEVTISPPCLPFYVTMKCPYCGNSTIAEQHKKNI